MNKREFFKTLALVSAGFTILPPATTYARIWKATKNQEIITISGIIITEILDPYKYWKFAYVNDKQKLVINGTTEYKIEIARNRNYLIEEFQYTVK